MAVKFRNMGPILINVLCVRNIVCESVDVVEYIIGFIMCSSGSGFSR